MNVNEQANDFCFILRNKSNKQTNKQEEQMPDVLFLIPNENKNSLAFCLYETVKLILTSY